MTVWSTAAAIIPDRQLDLAFHSLYFRGTLTYRCEPSDGGTVLHQDEVLVPRRLLRPWSEWIERTLQPRLQERLEGIQDLLERGHADAPLPGQP